LLDLDQYFFFQESKAPLVNSKHMSDACVVCACPYRWSEIHEAQVTGRGDWDEEKKREELTKWTKRKVRIS
jgi:hypothetical protein